MALIVRDVVSFLGLSQCVSVANGSTLPIYGTLQKANNYHASMLEGQRWGYTDPTRRFQALVSATKRIDRLNFIGVQTVVGQPLQFPRGTDTLIPADIEEACYDVALALLEGVEPDTEHVNSLTTLQAYGGLRSEFDRSSVLEYTANGIPSLTAWQKLLPYLLARREIELRRIS